MSQRTSKILIAGAMALGLAGLGGCATKGFVNQQVGQVSTRVDDVSGKVADVNARVNDHDSKLATLDQTSRDALERATAAGKLAEGKFLYQEVLTDDSMKFGVSKTSLSPEAQARLDAFVDKLKTDNRNVYVEVQGHTDKTGTKQANYRLGEERAEAVRRYLNEKGVALNRINTISYGADQPAAPNKNKAGRSANRRVVLIVLT
ncbi:OmpA family protein [Phenylobacterium sp.]|uniref:OmpA family protein n=1 Tax=Phenylobacterium sp. TaxID=1871053 RepID=UPI00374D4219